MSELFLATFSVKELISSFERKGRLRMIGFRSPCDAGDSLRTIIRFFLSSGICTSSLASTSMTTPPSRRCSRQPSTTSVVEQAVT
jgi:hypothetical protein